MSKCAYHSFPRSEHAHSVKYWKQDGRSVQQFVYQIICHVFSCLHLQKVSIVRSYSSQIIFLPPVKNRILKKVSHSSYVSNTYSTPPVRCVVSSLRLCVSVNGVEVTSVGVRCQGTYYINFGAGPNITCISNLSLALGQLITVLMPLSKSYI